MHRDGAIVDILTCPPLQELRTILPSLHLYPTSSIATNKQTNKQTKKMSTLHSVRRKDIHLYTTSIVETE